MNVTTSLSRSEQRNRRLGAYNYFKDLTGLNNDKKIKKEVIYQDVANKFGYANVTSVKAVIRELAKEEEKQIKDNIQKAIGIVETILCYEDLYTENFSKIDLDVRYNLKVSKNIEVIMIEGTYQIDSRREDFFDHFSVVDIHNSILRLTNLFLECNSKSLGL